MFIRDPEQAHRNPDRPTSLLDLQGDLEDDESHSRKRVNRISSPERWEIKQVMIYLLDLLSHIVFPIPKLILIIFESFSDAVSCMHRQI